MWTLRRLQNELSAMACAVAGVGLATPADAQFINNNGNVPSYYSSQNYNYGLNLPQVPLPTGQDEIRAADGTACRSNTASNNAYLDMGAIGSQGYGGEFDQGTFYGRVIVPLGDIPKRLDCSSLYNLEIQRLQHELALVRAGAGNLDAVSSIPDAPTIPMKIAGPQPAPVIQKPVAQNTVPSARGKAGGREKAWAKEGWSNSGWQGASKVGASKVGAPTHADSQAGTAADTTAEPQRANPLSVEPQPVGPQSSAASTASPVAMTAQPTPDAMISTASITAPRDATGDGAAAATSLAADATPATGALGVSQAVEIEVLPWLSYPAVGPRYVTLMTGQSAGQTGGQSSQAAAEQASQSSSADRPVPTPARDVSVADMTRNALGSSY